METIKNISESEWKVLEILWDKPGSLIGEIRTALDGSGWSYSTIKTLVLRLTQKGALRAEESDEGKRYYPNVDEDASRKSEARSFINRIYNGSLSMMVSSLVKGSKLSQSETAELMSLIDKMDSREEPDE